MAKGEYLTHKQAKFVEAMMKHGNGTKAAIEAGYSPKGQRAGKLLRESPAVRKAMAEIRQSVVDKGKYNLEIAMNEADEAIKFSKETENANAYVKALELKAKLNGLLVEKHEVRSAAFSISIAGLDELPAIETSLVDPIALLSSPSSDEDEEDGDIFA
jgi:phage terminase small subunit